MQARKQFSRRRALSIFAGAGIAALGATSSSRAGLGLEWSGRALGGQARISIRHKDRSAARSLLQYCLGEVERLEKIFSLYRRNSEIVTLNRTGRLDVASHDLRLLLGEAQRFGHISKGAFDVTVQPLWQLYSSHFGSPGQVAAPNRDEIEHARKLVDYRNIEVAGGAVRLARAGMGLTLNGMAQGYITDRISGILKDAGMTDVLVDLGEIRALEGGDWNIGIADPRRPGHTVMQLPLNGCAVATSAGAGTRFEATGRFHHLLDPMTGLSANRCLSATAIARSAMEADALATALAVAPSLDVATLLRSMGGQRAILLMADSQNVDVAV